RTMRALVVPVAAPAPATQETLRPTAPGTPVNEVTQSEFRPRATDRQESPAEAEQRLWKLADAILGGAESIVTEAITPEAGRSAKKPR
ncbi:MAG TPA: hypothetical protein VIV61_12480, partial [Candidatus Ozemobacteraceae bacterium]